MFTALRKLFGKPDFRIAIYVPDRAWGHGHPLTYERDSKRFRKELQKQYKHKFHLDNIGPGADWPAYVALISIPGVLATVVYIFFNGKEIKENIDAWKELQQRIKPYLVHHPVVNRDAAAVVAIEKIRSLTGNDASNIRLLGYDCVHMGENLDQYDFDALHSTQEAPEPLYLGVLFHAFYIEVDGKRFGALVYREDVRIRELPAASSH